MPDVSFLTLLSSLFFLIIGIGFIYLLVKIFLSAFRGSFGGLFERSAFRRHSLHCRRGDELLEQGDLAGAVQAFGGAFFLKPIRQDSALLTDIGKYHTGILNRLLTVADEMNKGQARLPSLADTDRLLAERLEIHLEHFRALNGEGTGEGASAGRLDERLQENERQIRTSVDRLLNEIGSTGDERVVYH